MILPILQQNDPRLRRLAEPVTLAEWPGIGKLLDDLVETLDHHNGVGIAAPQVGVNKRVVVLYHVAGDSNDLLERIVLINPVVTIPSGAVLYEPGFEEGCLSVENGTYFTRVKRYDQVEVKYIDRHGQPNEFYATDKLAIIVQHEVDHLDGVLFTDLIQQER